jgi:hypothetical protein
MKFFLMAFFSLSLLPLAQARDEKITCYKPVSPFDQRYSSIKVLSDADKIQKVKITHVYQNETVEDQNPEMTSRRLAPRCHGTLSGRYLCTPWTTVTEFVNFEKNIITSLYFESQNHGVIKLKDEATEITIKEISCF